MSETNPSWQLLREDVRERLHHAGKEARFYRIVHVALLVTGLVCGTLATTLSADSAMETRIVADRVAEMSTGKVPSELPTGWRMVCGLIAVLTLSGTVAQGVHSLLKIAENRAKAIDCTGRLDALLVDLSESNDEKLEAARREFIQIVREFNEYVR